jgi:hypothetical protein
MSSISMLQRNDGTSCEEFEEVKEEVHGIYTQLYRLEGDPMMDGLLSLVHENINGHTHETMDTQFTKEEVKKQPCSRIQMHPSKAPGVDGFTAGGFQRYWELVTGSWFQLF